MEQPHCNNSNNIHVVGGVQLGNYPTQRPDKSRCNGINEDRCHSFDQGYSSFCPENTDQDHLVVGPKSELQRGHSQSPLHNGYANPQPPSRYPGQRAPVHSSYSGESRDGHHPSHGPMCFSYSGEAIDDDRRSDPNSSGPPLTPYPQNVYQSHMQNGYPNSPAHHSCSGQGGPMWFSNSGEGMDDCQRSEPNFSGFPMKPNPQNSHQSRMQNGATSPRPPPVIRKHSSFTRQNAIEEEDDDDHRDELNDSGFGSMCRTTSWEKPRRSRSRDVSDAPGEEINNNLAPRMLQRAHSSTEKTDNEYAQYDIEKRRCSSEQLQRSNGSSGYFSANNIQGEVPAGDDARPCDLANAAAATAIGAKAATVAIASAEDEEDNMLEFKTIMSGLHDNLTSCKELHVNEWEVKELQVVIQSDTAFQQILAKEEHSRRLKDLSLEYFLNHVQSIPSDTTIHSTQQRDPSDKYPDSIKDLLISSSVPSDTTSHSTQQRDPSDKFPDSIKDLLISSSVPSDTTSHRTQQRDPSDKFPDSIKDLLISSSVPSDTTSHRTQQRDPSDKFPDSIKDLLISSSVPSDTTSHSTQQVSLHGDTLDQETRNNLQELLERRAYCEAMELNNCFDLKCFMMNRWRNMFEQCYCKSKLGECCDCIEIAQAYWNHSQGCKMDRCVLPFCAYFKDLYCEGEIIDDPMMNGFEEAFGCLIKEEEIDVLRRLNELEQLQQPAANDEMTWSVKASAENYLRIGQPGCHLKPEGRLCTFGRFTPIQCEVQKQTIPAKYSVVIKKVQYSQSRTGILQLLQRETRAWEIRGCKTDDPVLQDIISTCLWYREIRGGKLLVCSSFLSEKSLASKLDYLPDTLEKYWKEACKAAVFLHGLGILYLNWKVDHLVVTSEDRVKLCNFDYAVNIGSERGLCAEEPKGTEVPQYVKTGLDPRIAPPEVLNDRELFHESESWGLGCLLYQLHSAGRLPYHDLRHHSDDDIRELRLKEGHSKHVPDDFSMKKWLSETCWIEDAMKRKSPGDLPECLNRYRECLNMCRRMMVESKFR